MIKVGKLVKMVNVPGSSIAGKFGIVIEDISSGIEAPDYRILINEQIHELWDYEVKEVPT